MSVTELDVYCVLQGCPHLNIPVSLLQKEGLAKIFTADSRADPETFSGLHYSGTSPRGVVTNWELAYCSVIT